ncbi:MAG: glycosyltransferase family 4 protein, partial [Actinobacteria bacterium]|nr:glycosyltransferase family 4 protein [Actinomycetota bacterium]
MSVGAKRRALVVSNDHVGTAMAGPGIRAHRFAVELARDFDVTLVVPFQTDLAEERVEMVHDNPWDPARMSALVRGYDLVVAQRLPVPTMRTLANTQTRTIYDLYAPLTLEQLALDAREVPTSYRGVMARLNNLTQEVALATGDAFVCASEQQRDFWLGALTSAGRLDHELYERDPSLRTLIDVVPFGLDPEPPEAGPALRGVVPGIGADDRILLWPGGIWNWFDPLTVIQAVHQLSLRRDDVRLYFLGVKHPNPEVPDMSMAADAVALADELGLRDRVVFFNFGWVPYAERGRYLLDANLAVSAHFDDVETRFAFRTRLLDCLWAGLPLVTTRGDTLGDLIVDAGGGRAVGFGDVAG